MAYCIMRIEKRGRPLYGLEIEANRSQEDHTEKGRDFAASDISWELRPLIYTWYGLTAGRKPSRQPSKLQEQQSEKTALSSWTAFTELPRSGL